MKTLLFVDTNILLDFYRVRNDVSKSFIEHLERIADNVICTYQVEMEFKKNRQTAILEGSQQLKPPCNIPRPGILSHDRSYTALTKDIKKAEQRVRTLNSRLGRILEDPVRNDPIYQVLQRIFKKNDPLTLHRGTPMANRIRRLAFKRFILGYPPRKKGDTSTGDAVNWEWIVDCAARETANVLIVSRDSDFGVEREGKAHVNDWLREEFRDRVSKRAKVRMTGLLSEALKAFKVPVPKVAEKGEIRLVRAVHIANSNDDYIAFLRSLPKDRLEMEIDSKVADGVYDLIDEDAVASEIASSNATGWTVDDYRITDIELDTDPVEVKVSFHATGDQDEDKMFCGNELNGEAIALIERDGRVEFAGVGAELEPVTDGEDRA